MQDVSSHVGMHASQLHHLLLLLMLKSAEGLKKSTTAIQSCGMTVLLLLLLRSSSLGPGRHCCIAGLLAQPLLLRCRQARAAAIISITR